MTSCEAREKLKTVGVSESDLAAMDALAVDYFKLWALVQAIIKVILESGLFEKA